MAQMLKTLIAQLTPLSKRSLEAAANLALTRTHHEVDVEHVLLCLLGQADSDLVSALRAFGVDEAALCDALDDALAGFKAGNTRTPVLASQLPRWLEQAWLLASAEFKQNQISSAVLLLALLSDETLRQSLGDVSNALQQIDPVELRKALPVFLRQSREGNAPASSAPQATADQPVVQRGPNRTPALDAYTIDLTAQARADKIDPVLGRDAEIRQMIDILLRRRQNNPILTGEPGVGKTAVVEGLALRVAQGTVPDVLKNVVVRTLDLGLLQAGASVKGEFENRLRGVMDEVKASLTPIILFIDEAHTMIGAGGQAGQNDAANLLKPALARGELRTIAATTWAEYKKYFEKDAALARRFQVVKIDEPDQESAIQMLRAVAPAMEKHHKVRILDEAVVDAAKLSSRYIVGRQLPDKGISVLDTACARVALSQAGKPGPIEDVETLLGNIERECMALAKDGELHRHDARLKELAVRRTELEQDLATLLAAYEAQKAKVEEITTLRNELLAVQAAAEIDGGGKKRKKTDDPVGQVRSRLQVAQAELRALQKTQPLLYECVDGSTVADIISGWTGIPLGRMVADELETVRNLQNLLEERVIGQTHALAQIAERIRIAKANLEDPSKPKGVFLLVGPSGVGKTETALALADALYGGDRNLVTINMSEYQESHSVSGLKGSPPGYVGYGEGGVLTEAVRRRPYSVVLLDEVEKAHPDVLELFFQVFDKGTLEDAEGRLVDFKNTVIILTSNVGTDIVMRAMEHGVRASEDEEPRAPTVPELVDLLRPSLHKAFKPAFLGRLATVPYYPIQDDALRAIIRLKLSKVGKRLHGNHGVKVDFPAELVELIAERCLDVDSGARDADAIINRTVLPRLSDEILGRMAEGKPFKKLSLSVKAGELAVKAA
ncbi:MAG: ClpB protein [Proteobacteria bacterium]|nr:ClpB protein [Pseudomonadota bacterium]